MSAEKKTITVDVPTQIFGNAYFEETGRVHWGALQRAMDALAAAGYAVVPVKPTIRMCAAGGPEVRKACGLDQGPGDMHTIWAAMIAAASEPTR
jgi:hypothetical protein